MWGVIDPGGMSPNRFNQRTEELLKKYRDLINITEEKTAVEVLQSMVHIKKEDDSLIRPHRPSWKQMEIENVYHSGRNTSHLAKGIYFLQHKEVPKLKKKDEITLELYSVVEDTASKEYYDEIFEKRDGLEYSHFGRLGIVFCIVEPDLGIVETNSSEIHYDFILKRGVTQEDLDCRSMHLVSLLSTIDAHHT